MFLLLLLTGLIIVAFAAYKYTSINRNDPKTFSVFGIKFSEEIIWIALFVIGFTLMISVAIHFLEPHYAGRGTY